jgi:hypothetical protein
MKNDNDSFDDEIISRLSEEFLIKLDEKNYQYSKARLMKKARRRLALRMKDTHTLYEIAKAIGRSWKQAKRILES